MKQQSRHRDPLADIIVVLAAAMGRKANAQSLLHGLALENGQLAVEHLGAIAARADIRLTPWTHGLENLTESCLPCLMVDKDLGEGFVADSFETNVNGERTLNVRDHNNRPASVTLTTLKARQSLACHIARPLTDTDERTSFLPVATRPHWFWSALKINRGIYGHVIAATLAINLLALAIPLTTMNVYDRVVANAAFTTLWSLALGAGIAVTFDLFLRLARAVMVDRASARSDVLLANRIFDRLLGARLQGRGSSVGVQANTLREFESLREFFNAATIAALGDLPFLVLFLAVIFMVAGPMVLVPAVAIPLVLAIGWITQRKLDQVVSESFLQAAHKNAVVVESLSGLETIKSLAAESRAASLWESAVASNLRFSLKSRFLMTLGTSLVSFATGLTTIALLVFGVYLVNAGTITPGAMFAATILNGRCMAPLGQIAGLLTRVHQARMAFSALKQIVDLPQERSEGMNYLTKSSYKGDLEFDRVNFAYEDEAPDALRDISLKIAPGERVGVIGGVGSGKSTLIKLALGLHRPRDGRVLVDGLPVDQVDPANWRLAVGTLLQDTTLFHGSIRDNVQLGVHNASDEDLVRALNMSGALDWIRTLPQGIDSIVGERGAGLSGGQRQTLCLARAFIANHNIYLLDEPASNMDGITEKAFISRFKKNLGKSTLLLVTHKPSLLTLVDRLVVMERGQILLDGPKQDVMEKLKTINAERQGKAA